MENDRALHIIEDELEALKKRIIDNHIRARQVASGRTIRSLKVQMDDNGGILWGRQAFGVLETGRGPGKVPKGFYQKILEWVHDKGIQVEKPKTFAYFVAKKIKKEGTELYRKGGINDIYSKEIPKTVNNISNRIFTLLEVEVESININDSR